MWKNVSAYSSSDHFWITGKWHKFFLELIRRKPQKYGNLGVLGFISSVIKKPEI